MAEADGGEALGPAVVTGGSSGIGLAVALRLAGRGHPVLLIARRLEPLERAAASIRAAVPGARVAIRAVDVRDAAALAAVIGETAAAFGPVAWLVAAAGIAEPGRFVDLAPQAHRDQMEINYLGTLHAVHAVVPTMRAARRGRVVLISSGAGLFGIYGYSAYAPSKFAVRGLAEVLRLELEEEGITVTLVCPPDTDTPQLAAERAKRPPATAAIAAGAGVWSADAVAAAAIAAATAGRFLVAPGLALGLLARLHSLIAPFLVRHQRRIVRALARPGRRAHGSDGVIPPE